MGMNIFGAPWTWIPTTMDKVREFRDVVFEDMVLDNYSSVTPY